MTTEELIEKAEFHLLAATEMAFTSINGRDALVGRQTAIEWANIYLALRAIPKED